LVEDAILIKFGEKPELSKSKSDSRKNSKSTEGTMDNNTVVEIYKFISSINHETSGREPSLIVLRMANLLKSLKFHNSSSKDILRYLNSENSYS